MPQRRHLALTFRLSRGVIVTEIGTAVLLIILLLQACQVTWLSFARVPGPLVAFYRHRPLAKSYIHSVLYTFAEYTLARPGYLRKVIPTLLLAFVRLLQRRKLSITVGLLVSLTWLNYMIFLFMCAPRLGWYIALPAIAAMLIGSLMKD